MADKILMDIIGEHLPYEIDMLRSMYLQLAKLSGNPETVEQQLQRMALIEALCVHSRSMIDFFSNIPGPFGDAIAKDFTAGYTPIDHSVDPIKTIRNKINKQIFHLTKDRTIVEADKFDAGKDGAEVLKAIEPAIEHFSRNLSPDFGPYFKCNTQPVLTLTLTPFASATSVIQSPITFIGGQVG